LPDACEIRVPAIIADYITCIGTMLDESLQPYFLRPQITGATGWMNVSADGATAWEGNPHAIMHPLVSTSAALNVLGGGGTTWNTALATVNGTWSYPQKYLGDLCKVMYNMFSGINGAADFFVTPETKISFGGICTQATVCQSLSNNFTLYTFSAQISSIKRISISSMQSAYPLSGSNLTRAFIYAYQTTSTMANNSVAKFVMQPPSDNVLINVVDFLLQQTVQVDGSFQQELAIARQKSSRQTVDIGGTGTIVTSNALPSAKIIDNILSEASSFLGQTLERGKDAVIKIGSQALPLLGKTAMTLLKDVVAPMIGAAVFA